jgi:hypothetical protein
MNTIPETLPNDEGLSQVKTHEMLMRLLKVAELLNKGNHDQQAANEFADQISPPDHIFVEKERKKP